MKSRRPKAARSGMHRVSTIAKPGEDRPGHEVGGKIVLCQPGTMPTAKSSDTTVWTDTTSGVARPASSR